MRNPAEVCVYIGVGSNLGESRSLVQRALGMLAATHGCHDFRSSPWYRSKAIGPGIQNDYINGVVGFRSHLPELELLEAMQVVESACGRTRAQRWAARTLDLDMLLYGDACIDSVRLTVPHPRLAERNFVVFPLFDLAPALVLPDGVALATVRRNLDWQGLELLEQQAEPLSV